MRRERRFASLRMDLIEREVAKDVAKLASIDVLRLYLPKCLIEKAAAEGALIVGKFHHRERRVFAAEGSATGRRYVRALRFGLFAPYPRKQLAQIRAHAFHLRAQATHFLLEIT